MTILNRRNVWLVLIVVLAAMLGTWITASAASPTAHSSAQTTVRYSVLEVYGHNWENFSKPGQTGQMVYKLLGADGKQVGTGYWSVTDINGATLMATGEMRFPNRGRVEVQGVWPWSNTASSGGTIIGGTGVFRGVHGQGYYTDATGLVTMTYYR